MAKTPKKPAPGGDESNLYVRRLKATTSGSLSASDATLPPAKQQRESENPNRGKAIGVQKKQTGPPGKVFKPSTSKDEKKPAGTTSKDRETVEMPTAHAEPEEAAMQLKVSITKKDIVKDVERAIISAEETTEKAETPASEDHASSNGKNAIDLAEAENATPRGAAEKEGSAADKNTTTKQPAAEEKQLTESRDNGNESSETISRNEKHDETEAENPSSEFEENSLKLEDEEEVERAPKSSERNGDSQESHEGNVKEAVQESAESKKSSENCSVDVVESTTSEPTDSGVATQSSEKDAETNGDQGKDNPEIDASFISYDASIMLKDVQIKLNDCLKDNSKLFDVSNANEESIAAASEAEQQKRLDMSFGKTLRNISGRSTINRLRYVTVREHRFSPNSSLFVNTSSASLDPEESCKLLRHTSDFSDSLLTNGSPADRKRKIVTESAASAKKLKTEKPERSSIFNTSLEILKSIRRPIQVSTPNAKGYQFTAEKYGDDKLAVEEAEPKKWCVVM